MLNFENIKYQQTHDFILKTTSVDTFTFIFSIVDLSSTDFKKLKKNLKDQGCESRLMNLSFFKKSLDQLHLYSKLNNILNGFSLITLYQANSLDKFKIQFDKKQLNSFYLVGILNNYVLYYPSFLIKFNSMTNLKLFSKLISLLFFKQSLLYFYMVNLKSFFYKKS